jgi:rhodanese-related sulfurtransferase
MKTSRFSRAALLVIVAGFMLAACAAPTAGLVAEAQAPAPTVEQTAAPVATPEATEAPTEAPKAGDADLDKGYGDMLASMKGFNFIQPADLKAMLDGSDKPFLVDVREMEEVAKAGYIKGSILIPIKGLAKNLDKLPAFDTNMVLYCGSGWRCAIGMAALQAMGWTHSKALAGGSFGGWTAAKYPVETGVPEDAKALNAATPDPAMVAKMDAMLSGLPEGYGSVASEKVIEMLKADPKPVLIDVRTPDEVKQVGMIEGAVGIPLADFIAMKDKWPADKAAPIVVYCKVGGRSAIALAMLRSYGYTNVLGIKGGIEGWIAAGGQVVK